MALDASRRWRGWTRAFVLTAAGFAALLLCFAVLLDPYGARVHAGQTPRPLMDINQRFMYPQLVRSGRFNGAILGTSTMRLLDPVLLSQGLGATMVNLAMNAATPWEQVQIAGLAARHGAGARQVIWGIDATWCEADATEPGKRLTPRPFPAWLYDGVSLADWLKLANFGTLEIATRLLGFHLGLTPARIRGDGYEVFTPPEASYDLARARFHLFRNHGGVRPDTAPLSPPEAVPDAIRAQWRFPALDWLDRALAGFPGTAQKLIVLPPLHLSAQPRDGSTAGQHFEACKAELRAIAQRRGAILVDYARDSAITRQDENYWDPLHFRLPIARRVEAELIAIEKGDFAALDAAAVVLRPKR